MDYRFKPILTSKALVISFVNLFGLSLAGFLSYSMVSGVLFMSTGYLLAFIIPIVSFMTCIFSAFFFFIKLNNRIIYRFSAQFSAACLIPILIIYLLRRENPWSYTLPIVGVPLLQGLFFKVRYYIKKRINVVPPIPLSYDIETVASKTWAVFIPVIIINTIFCIPGCFIEHGIIDLYVMLFYSIVPLWLLIVCFYLLGFNRPFFDSIISQILWVVMFELVYLIEILCNNYFHKSFTLYIFVASVAPILFFVAQGLYHIKINMKAMTSDSKDGHE